MITSATLAPGCIDDGPRVVEPPWMRACDAERADGTALATPAYLSARCLDAFRAAHCDSGSTGRRMKWLQTPSREPPSRASRTLGLYGKGFGGTIFLQAYKQRSDF